MDNTLPSLSLEGFEQKAAEAAAMLKALGFTPGQVVRMLLAEQTLLGAAGAAHAVEQLATSKHQIEGTPPPME